MATRATVCTANFTAKDDKSGLHYWRLTSKEADLGDKMLYDPVLAFKQTETNADHYVASSMTS